jgi:hypothetical protein
MQRALQGLGAALRCPLMDSLRRLSSSGAAADAAASALDRMAITDAVI